MQRKSCPTNKNTGEYMLYRGSGINETETNFKSITERMNPEKMVNHVENLD